MASPCGPDEYYSGSTETCQPCLDVCRGTSTNECRYRCPDYTIPVTTPGHTVNSVPGGFFGTYWDYWPYVLGAVFLVLSVAIVLLVVWRRRSCRSKSSTRSSTPVQPEIELDEIRPPYPTPCHDHEDCSLLTPESESGASALHAFAPTQVGLLPHAGLRRAAVGTDVSVNVVDETHRTLE